MDGNGRQATGGNTSKTYAVDLRSVPLEEQRQRFDARRKGFRRRSVRRLHGRYLESLT